jgi:hypothetical protein
MTDAEDSPFQHLLQLAFEAKPDATDEELSKLVNLTVEMVAPVFTRELRKATPRMLIDHRAQRAGFEVRLQDPWGPALDALESLYVASMESGEMYLERTADEANAEDDHLFTALVGIHIRACHVASEIYALLRTGHASGALSRWRTLHELAVVMSFLSERGPDVAARYLEHEAIRTWHEAQDYQKFAGRLGEKRFPIAAMKEMDAARTVLIAKYGKPYDEDWGWAAHELKAKRPTFRDIEEAVELEHWRPHYRFASDSLHAGPKALFFRLGSDDAIETPIAGPSNLGLEDPGMGAAISLTISTATLLAHRADMEGIVTTRVMLEMSRRAVRAFSRAGRILDRRIAEEADEAIDAPDS